MGGGWWAVVGGQWLVGGGWWAVVGGRWLVGGGWWAVDIPSRARLICP